MGLEHEISLLALAIQRKTQSTIHVGIGSLLVIDLAMILLLSVADIIQKICKEL